MVGISIGIAGILIVLGFIASGIQRIADALEKIAEYLRDFAWRR